MSAVGLCYKSYENGLKRLYKFTFDPLRLQIGLLIMGGWWTLLGVLTSPILSIGSIITISLGGLGFLFLSALFPGRLLVSLVEDWWSGADWLKDEYDTTNNEFFSESDNCLYLDSKQTVDSPQEILDYDDPGERPSCCIFK